MIKQLSAALIFTCLFGYTNLNSAQVTIKASVKNCEYGIKKDAKGIERIPFVIVTLANGTQQLYAIQRTGLTLLAANIEKYVWGHGLSIFYKKDGHWKKVVAL